MTILIKVFATIILAVLSAILGRMGGAEGYDTKFRDAGCSILSVLTFIIWFGFRAEHWYWYIASFGLHWAAFSTYFDFLFGYDNFWFSGLAVSISILPLAIIESSALFMFFRAIILAGLWQLFNKCLPNTGLLGFRHDVAEELLRYGTVIITYLLKIF